MAIRPVNTENAPAAIGPYSQAVTANGMLFASGQIPLDAATGEIIDGDTAAQATQVLTNLKAVVEAAGAALSDTVKVTIYLKDMQQFAAVNEVYGSFFTSPYPARACVEVSELPKGVDVEMDAIVLLPVSRDA